MIPLETSRIYDVNLWTKISSRRATYPVISSCPLVISSSRSVSASSRSVISSFYLRQLTLLFFNSSCLRVDSSSRSAISYCRLFYLRPLPSLFFNSSCRSVNSSSRFVISFCRLFVSQFVSTVNSLCRPSTRRVQVLRRFF